MTPGAGVTLVFMPGQPHAGLVREDLYAAAAQVHPEIEVVLVVEPGGRAAVVEEADRLGGLLSWRLFERAGGPAGVQFDDLLQAVQTPYCAIVPGLDLVYPRFAAVLVAALISDAGAVAACGGGYLAEGALEPFGFRATSKTRWMPPDPPGSAPVDIPLAGLLARTEALAAVGTLSDTAARLADRGRVVSVPATVFERRVAFP